jgi:hypothetical protein
MVTLPPEPIYPDSPPAICATCDTEIPDYRRESYTPPADFPAAPAGPTLSPTPTPISPTQDPSADKKLSRGGLFRSLGGFLAERAEDTVENAKSHFEK